MNTGNRNTDDILKDYFDGLEKTDDLDVRYEDSKQSFDNIVAALGGGKLKKTAWTKARMLPAAVFSVMTAAIIVLTVLTITAWHRLPDNGGGATQEPASYVVVSHAKIDTVSSQYNILVPGYEFFRAPESVSVLREHKSQKDVFVKIQYNNYKEDSLFWDVREKKNETLVFNVVLDSSYSFPELRDFQNLDKADTAGDDIGCFSYGSSGNTVYATFVYSGNSYYLSYTSDSGSANDLVYLIKCLYREYIKVDSVKIGLPDNSSKLPYSKQEYIYVYVLPFEATYKNFELSIEKILKADGTPYEGNLNKYAYIEQNGWSDGLLHTTLDIEIGAKIYIYAVTDTDRVRSNTLEIEIARIPVERIDFWTLYHQTSLLLGEEAIYTVSVYPADATFNYLSDSEIKVSINDDSLAALKKINDRQYLITAANIFENYLKDFEITVTIEGLTKKFDFTLTKTFPQSLALLNSETGQELEREIEMPRNSVLRTTAVVIPENAHGKARCYFTSNIQNYGIYIDYDQNGVLIIKPNAPIGMEIYLSASLSQKSSGTYKIVVIKTPAENITVYASAYTISPHDGESMDFGGCVVYLSANIVPANADIERLEYKILNASGLTGIFISGTMIFASSSAVIGEIIEVQAVVDGIESNIIRILITDGSG